MSRMRSSFHLTMRSPCRTPTAEPGPVGLRQGDLIVKWNEERIRDVRTIIGALGPDSVGQTAKLSLLRGGEPIEVTLTIAERPES